MANEKRLIDANVLKIAFKCREKADIDMYGGCHIAECFQGYEACEIVDKMPTVEVGHCKGCYYYESSNPGHGYCKYFDTLRIDNDFCSSWERKGNG